MASPAAAAASAQVNPKLKRRAARRTLAGALFAFAGVALMLSVIGYVLLTWFPFQDPDIVSAVKRITLILAATMLVLIASGFLVSAGPRREWERIYELILGQRALFANMLYGSTLLVLMELSLPLVLKYVLDEVVNVRHDARLLGWLLVGIVGLVLLRALAGYVRTFNAQALGYSIATDLRNRLYAHLQRLSYSYFDRARQGELMSKVTNDVVTLQNFILNSSEDFFVAPLKVIGGVACVFYLNWQLALVIVVCAVAAALLLRFMQRRLRRINDAVQLQMGDLTAELAEGINTIRLAQSFGLEHSEFDRFRSSNLAAYQRVLKQVQISAVLLPLVDFLGFIAPLAIIAMLCFDAIARFHSGLADPTQPLLEVGKLVAIAGYAGLVANPLGKLSRLLVTLSMGEAASQRIFSVLETKAEIADKPGALALEGIDGFLQFEQVRLRYGPEEPWVLDGFTLEVAPGQVVALVGESGSGKSSVINLVPRFYEVTDGRVLLDGHDLRDITLASLRRHIGIVSQDTILVHGTVRDNISYGSPEADEKDIVDAAMSAGAHGFIMEFPQGYDTLVGERGVTLSGGQRQRIAIARALLRDPRILLLDEATSALDSVSEAAVQGALNKLMYGRTTLVVAHRLSTVRHADRIVVLKHGRIVESGSHDELLSNGQGEYARLVKMQGL